MTSSAEFSAVPTRTESLPDASVPSGGSKRLAALHLWLANVGLGVVLGWSYLVHVPDAVEARLWLFVLPALVSTVFLLTALPGLSFLLIVPRIGSRAAGWLQGCTWSLFQVLLYTDTRIYHTFRYHWNGQVLNLLASPDAGDSVELGWQVWLTVTVGLSSVFVLERILWRGFLSSAISAHPADSQQAPRRWVAFLRRPAAAALGALLAAVFVEKTLYAQADLNQDRHLTALSRIFPLYPRLPVKDLSSVVLGHDVGPRLEVELEDVQLDYPHAFPELPPYEYGVRRPNVLMVVIDCWRSDMLDPTQTPGLWSFSENGRRFENHLSGGNSTRYGLFSLLYGLHGSYWFSALNEEAPPALVEALDAAGYDLRVFSSANMYYPELRSTAWSTIPDAVEDDFPAELPWERDVMATEACVRFWDERDGRGEDRPFFAFLLLDSPHQKYSYPEGRELYQPAADGIDYMALSTPRGLSASEMLAIKNRYRNAVHFADEVATGLLADLGSRGQLEDTIVVITGDHGEEFEEHGFFGHTSSFTPEQLRVPMILYGPGIEGGVEHRPTSHLDVAPTILELLGADPDLRPSYCVGANLLEPLETRSRAVSGWNELGLWTDSAILRMPRGLFGFEVESYDYDWQLLMDDADVLRDVAPTLEELAEECRRFLDPVVD